MSQPRTHLRASTVGPLPIAEGTCTPSVTSDANGAGITSQPLGAAPLPPRGNGAIGEAGSTGHRYWIAQDIVDEWGLQSFPASDPPANW
jgi:hypothetical protein